MKKPDLEYIKGVIADFRIAEDTDSFEEFQKNFESSEDFAEFLIYQLEKCVEYIEEAKIK